MDRQRQREREEMALADRSNDDEVCIHCFCYYTFPVLLLHPMKWTTLMMEFLSCCQVLFQISRSLIGSLKKSAKSMKLKNYRLGGGAMLLNAHGQVPCMMFTVSGSSMLRWHLPSHSWCASIRCRYSALFVTYKYLAFHRLKSFWFSLTLLRRSFCTCLWWSSSVIRWHIIIMVIY